MKKKWCIAALAILALGGGIAIAIPALQPPGPGVTKANFDRIEIGMTKEDLEGIFGECPFLVVIGGDFRYADHVWIGEDGSRANVSVCPGRGVHSKHWTESTETITDKFRRWLHLPRN